MKKQNKIGLINTYNCHQKPTDKEHNQIKIDNDFKFKKRINEQLMDMQVSNLADQTIKNYKQTINQLSLQGESCSANSGVGLSYSQGQAGNSLLPNECPGAATITNCLLPSSPWDTLEPLYQLCLTYSGAINKLYFAMAYCLFSVFCLKVGPGNNMEGLPME